MIQQRRPVTPERLEAMQRLGGEAGRMFQRHSSGAGGVIRALAEDLLDLLAVYEAAERERYDLSLRVAAAVAATEDTYRFLTKTEEVPDAAG